MSAVASGSLRPIERRVLALQRAGYGEGEIARRFRRGPRSVQQISELARLDGRHADDVPQLRLRPIERRILDQRDRGVGLEELGRRFRRSPENVAMIERVARYKLRRASR
jgi:transcriptional regulator